MSLESFLAELHQEAFDTAHDDRGGSLRLAAMAKPITDRLDEVGHLSDCQWAYCRNEAGKIAAEVHAYAYDPEEDALQLVYFVDASEDAPIGSPPEVVSIPKSKLDRAFKRLEGFVQLARANRLQDFEESQPAHELIELVRDSLECRREITLHVITTGTVSDRAVVSIGNEGLQRDVWDLLRLSRVCRGKADEKICVDFINEFDESLPCLVTEPSEDGIQVLFTFIPGVILAEIYKKYHSRLLERNVRSFLQFTGKVNQGIRNTILFTPSYFLPYNNGLSVTASSVELHDSENGLARLHTIRDFQIVNGGQTTATLSATLRRDDADLSKVNVAVKLTVIPEERVEELVPRISEYANTQNRIQASDFNANNEWHVEMERFSRSVWLSPTPEAPRGTRWFYERSRGQYMDELARQKTPASRKKFRAENPPKQKFTKTDLAKYRLSWEQRPQVVSLGAQKCFAKFMAAMPQGRKPDEAEYKRTIALGFLFKTAERLYGELDFTGYRAQVVTYAVARLSLAMQSRLPFDEIWESQQIPPDIVNALKLLLTGVREAIVDECPTGANITEWCKKDQCWTSICQRQFDLGDGPWDGTSVGTTPPLAPEEQALVDAVESIPAEVWVSVATWAKGTDSLNSWQRKFSFSIGQQRAFNKALSIKQAKAGKKLMISARELGFVHPLRTTDMMTELNSGSL